LLRKVYGLGFLSFLIVLISILAINLYTKQLITSKPAEQEQKVELAVSDEKEIQKEYVKPIYSDNELYSDPKLCRVKSKIKSGENIGFPRLDTFIPTVGNRKTLVIFVDYLDLPFDPKQISEWKNNQIPTFKKFISSMSYGKLKYSVDVHEEIFHIDKTSISYNLDTAQGQPLKPNADMAGLIRDAIAVADPNIDFSQYEFFNVVMPPTTNIGIEGTMGLPPDTIIDGKKFNHVSFGPISEYVDDDRKKIWFLHEVGHMMGLLHAFELNDYPFWGVMSNGISTEPEFMGWERFLLGWINTEQISCINNNTPKTYTLNISPLASAQDAKKLVIIKLKQNKILVIEYRVMNELSRITTAREGAIVYLVDADIPANQGAMKLIANNSNKNGILIGSLLEAETVTFENIRVKVLGNFLDRSDLEVSIN
jgi:M6 family metalloprotease-like protein